MPDIWQETTVEPLRARCEVVFESLRSRWASAPAFYEKARKLFGEDAQGLLEAGVAAGILRAGERGDYSLVPDAAADEGTVWISEDDEITVRVGPGDTLRIHPNDRKIWWYIKSGDKVRVRRPGRGRKFGSILAITQVNEEPVEGTVVGVEKNAWIVRSDVPRMLSLIRVPQDRRSKLSDGERVVVSVERTNRDRPLRGSFVRVGNAAGQIDLREAAIIREFSLAEAPYVLEPAAGAEIGKVLEQARSDPHRADLRSVPFVTIDGARARDFDDAVVAERLSYGYRVQVAVADVAQYVQEGSSLDRDARERGTSVYFPSRVLPMLPLELSENWCSLKPDEDRLAMVVTMEFDAHGRRIAGKLSEAIIHNHQRLTYEQVKQFADGDVVQSAIKSPLQPSIALMLELTQHIRARRTERGGLDFDMPEPYFVIGLRGEVTQMLRNERHIAHFLIEELMIAANETVAEQLSAAGYPVMYRVHEPPPHDKSAQLIEVLRSFGATIPKEFTQKDLQAILEQYAGLHRQKVLQMVMLRAMSQAYYGVDNQEHWGLVSPCYCHFTSPIRRYPDLINHRLVKRWLRRGDLPQTQAGKLRGDIEAQARKLSERERNAEQAERRIVKHLQMRFASECIGQRASGVVVAATTFGLFVELEQPYCEGLLHISELGNDQWVYDERRACIYGKRSGRQWRLGDTLQVKIARVDLQMDRCDLELV